MIVSFLIPTRQRVDTLLEGIKSVKKLASKDVQLEFIIKVDDDDHETLSRINEIPGEIMIGPRWAGYNSAHIFFNKLAKKCHGDWIISWSDDLFMMTRNWDKFLPQIDTSNKSWIYWFNLPGSWTWALPIITRKLYNSCKYYSSSPPVDHNLFRCWELSENPLQTEFPIIVEHRRDEENIYLLAIKPEYITNPPANELENLDVNLMINALRNSEI